MKFNSGVAAAAVAAALLSLGISMTVGPRLVMEVVAGAARLRAIGSAGWLLFIGVEFSVTIIGVVPGALLGIAAGAIFGISLGFLTSSCGILAGAMVAFAVSRSMLRPWIRGILERGGLLARLDGLIMQDGWRIVALLRISPVMPFSLTSYALGLSGISFRNYFLGTLASLPALLGYVVIGTLGDLGFTARRQGAAEIHVVLLTIGVVATLALTIHVSRMLGRAFRVA